MTDRMRKLLLEIAVLARLAADDRASLASVWKASHELELQAVGEDLIAASRTTRGKMAQ